MLGHWYTLLLLEAVDAEASDVYAIVWGAPAELRLYTPPPEVRAWSAPAEDRTYTPPPYPTRHEGIAP